MSDYLALAADFLMIAASLGAALYCLILSRRLSRLTSFDKGIGGAIAVMSQQVDEMRAALSEARSGTEGAGHHLQSLVSQAREISGELELMIAACHDFAEEAIEVQAAPHAASAQPPAAVSAAPHVPAVFAAPPVPAASAVPPVPVETVPAPVPVDPAPAPVDEGPTPVFSRAAEAAERALPVFGSRRAARPVAGHAPQVQV